MERIFKDTRNAERILQLTADTMLLVDEEGNCIDVSTHSSLWVLQEEFLLGKNLFNLLPEGTRNEFAADLRNVLKTQKEFTRNYSLRTSREKFYFKCIMHPFDGRVLCQCRDITERSNVKRQLEIANQKLSENESKIRRLNTLLDAIMKNLPAGVVVKDIENDFRHIYRNKEAHNRLSIIDKGYAIGKTDMELHEPFYALQIREEDIEIARTGKSFHRIFEDRDANGQRIVLDKLKMKLESEGLSPLILSIEWNITELEDMKRQLEQAKMKAEKSDKLKSAFLANMSHEIRTPLNAIVGFSRVIMECDDPKDREEYYEVVKTNNERLLNLINEILDLSKIESGIIEFTYSKMPLDELCNDVFQAHVFRCPPKVQLVYEPSDRAIYTTSDKNRVFQVISNLIGNALKFTVEGSISFGYRLETDHILFYVRDTGSGIASDKVDKVFDRFVKANSHVQGTGLGLSICKTIVERLGGEIWVTSELGKGTTFFFTLPIEGSGTLDELPDNRDIEMSLLAATTAQSTLIQKPVEEIVVLVAEDTDSNYDLLEAVIGNKYKLIRAHDGIEAVTLFEELRPDLILMDIKMPNLDGLEATRIIRELSPETPIIAQSAYAYEQDRNGALQAGCNDFIAKPIMIDILNEILGRWLPT